MALATGWAQLLSVAMAKTKSSAKRTNRVIALLAVLLLIGSGAATVFGDPSSGSGPSENPEETIVPSGEVGAGTRPAETSDNNFYAGLGIEQYDFKMKSLDCDAMNDHITTDLCGVARTKHGDFMLTAAEGYWDPADGEVTLEMSIYGFRKDFSVARAVGLLDAQMTRDLKSEQLMLDLYRTVVNGDEVLIGHRHPADADVDGYEVSDDVFIIAASPTGAPTVVAWYTGPGISFESDGESVFLLYKRYGVDGIGSYQGWNTEVRLFPSDRDVYSWSEEINSVPVTDELHEGRVPMKLLDSYLFPVVKPKGSTLNSSEA